MAAPSIPRPILAGLSKIATLPDDSFQQLLSALNDIPLRIRQHRVFDDVGFKLDGISPEESKDIRDALFPIYLASTNQEDIASYIHDITRSIKDEQQADTQWIDSSEARARFKERLAQLLGIKKLQLVAKAHDVLLEHSQTFSSARILSDIRPVFGESVKDSPEAAVIVHMLNLVYYKDSERREFVVALDTKDIPYFIEVLERAQAKTESLKTIIASTGITYLEIV